LEIDGLTLLSAEDRIKNLNPQLPRAPFAAIISDEFLAKNLYNALEFCL